MIPFSKELKNPTIPYKNDTYDNKLKYTFVIPLVILFNILSFFKFDDIGDKIKVCVEDM